MSDLLNSVPKVPKEPPRSHSKSSEMD